MAQIYSAGGQALGFGTALQVTDEETPDEKRRRLQSLQAAQQKISASLSPAARALGLGGGYSV